MKPRFPLSVRRNIVYRAKIDDTNVTLYSTSFKDLYKVVRATMRNDVLYQVEGFKCETATLEYGIETMYEEKPNYFYTEWMPIARCGVVYVSKLSESVYRSSDGHECIMRKTWILSQED